MTQRFEVGNVRILISDGGPLPPEDWADLAVSKIIGISNEADPVIREQANLYRDRIKGVVADYIRKAIENDRAFREGK